MEIDLAAFATPILTALVTGVSIYVGMSEQITVVKTEIKNLTKQVEKHNSIVERTFKLESDTATMWKRVDELREEIHDIRNRLE